MEGVLWYLLASSRGSGSRVRILRCLDERPRNPNQLAEELDLDYTTVRYHLDVLEENSVVEKTSDGYGAVYLLSDRLESNRDTFEEIIETADPNGPDGSA